MSSGDMDKIQEDEPLCHAASAPPLFCETSPVPGAEDDPDSGSDADVDEPAVPFVARCTVRDVVMQLRPCTLMAVLALWELVFPGTAVAFIICSFVFELIAYPWHHPMQCRCVVCDFTKDPGVEGKEKAE
jgi:hypothetical protein